MDDLMWVFVAAYALIIGWMMGTWAERDRQTLAAKGLK